MQIVDYTSEEVLGTSYKHSLYDLSTVCFILLVAVKPERMTYTSNTFAWGSSGKE